jgi:hypothetical protein
MRWMHILRVMVALLVLAGTAGHRTAAEEINPAAAVAIAGIIALAIARHGDDHDHHADWDEGLYGEPFSPSSGVVCLPKPRQCYDDGRYSHRWTRRIFG